jgi:hypothetical protein
MRKVENVSALYRVSGAFGSFIEFFTGLLRIEIG